MSVNKSKIRELNGVNWDDSDIYIQVLVVHDHSIHSAIELDLLEGVIFPVVAVNSSCFENSRDS